MRQSRIAVINAPAGGSFAIPTFDGSHAIFGDEKQGYIELYSSGTLTLPKKGVVDVFMIGGGQKGGFGGGTIQSGTTTIGFPISGGKGGDGGKKLTFFGVEVEAGAYEVAVGSAAGNTTCVGFSTASGTIAAVGAAAPVFTLAEAQGSTGGKKGINGNSADFAFGDSNFPRYGGSGGSGLTIRSSVNFAQSSGGTLGGGNGAGYRSSGATRLEATAGTANTGGGGGGGGYMLNMWQSSPASGGSGIVIIRWGYAA